MASRMASPSATSRFCSRLCTFSSSSCRQVIPRSASSSSVGFSFHPYSSSPLSSAATFSDARFSTKQNSENIQRKRCLCSPSNHHGAFKCSYHRRSPQNQKTTSCHARSSRHLRKSAIKNSLIRMGGKEAEVAEKTLSTMVTPSLAQQRRRENFQPRPTRLSLVSKDQD